MPPNRSRLATWEANDQPLVQVFRDEMRRNPCNGAERASQLPATQDGTQIYRGRTAEVIGAATADDMLDCAQASSLATSLERRL